MAAQPMEEGRKEGNVLFKNALNTFYLQLYGVGHIAKDHSAREEISCHHYMKYSFRLATRVLLYATDTIVHTTAFVTQSWSTS